MLYFWIVRRNNRNTLHIHFSKFTQFGGFQTAVLSAEDNAQQLASCPWMAVAQQIISGWLPHVNLYRSRDQSWWTAVYLVFCDTPLDDFWMDHCLVQAVMADCDCLLGYPGNNTIRRERLYFMAVVSLTTPSRTSNSFLPSTCHHFNAFYLFLIFFFFKKAS